VSDGQPEPGDPVLDLLPLIRRVVGARVRDPQLVDDLVQETLLRVMAARSRVEGDTLAPYAVVTARNLIVSAAQREQRARRNAHLLVDPDAPADLDEETLRREEASLVGTALARLSRPEREILLAHGVGGVDTASLAAERGRRPARSPLIWRGPGRGSGSTTCWPSTTPSRRPTAAGPSSRRSRPPTGAGSGARQRRPPLVVRPVRAAEHHAARAATGTGGPGRDEDPGHGRCGCGGRPTEGPRDRRPCRLPATDLTPSPPPSPRSRATSSSSPAAER
jgi:RNA polymerase sigma factor (sigma-70 family)